jgi:hypothetical protein
MPSPTAEHLDAIILGTGEGGKLLALTLVRGRRENRSVPAPCYKPNGR